MEKLQENLSKNNFSSEWLSYFTELENLIEEKKEIKVTEDSIKIPENYRSIFYKQFDKIRDEFIINNFPDKFELSSNLSREYRQLENKIMKKLSLKDITMSNNVERFLHNPLNELRRELFDLLIDLLIKNISREEFIKVGRNKIEASLKSTYKIAYTKYSILKLIDELKAEDIYYIPMSIPSSTELIKHPIGLKESVPPPQKADKISFEVPRKTTILIPDFIIYSAEIKKYIAFRTELGKALWEAGGLSRQREWISIEDIIKENGPVRISPDLLLYIDNDLENINLAADAAVLCRPDIVFECADSINVDLLEDKAEALYQYTKILKPFSGSYLIQEEKNYADLEDKYNETFEILALNRFNSDLDKAVKLLKDKYK
ncbi:MAG: hypothetical protein ACQESS_01865 [Bacillota bacterium]